MREKQRRGQREGKRDSPTWAHTSNQQQIEVPKKKNHTKSKPNLSKILPFTEKKIEIEIQKNKNKN